jgi:hypothetical protein
MEIEFQKDGRVDIKASKETCTGVNWFFKPGPAHLDTCEFYVRSNTKANLTLKYVGFIDRGQRVESRVSRRPIRMTGRVVSLLKDEVLGSSRFIMVLKRSGSFF